MACRDAYKLKNQITAIEPQEDGSVLEVGLMFGVDSNVRSDNVLQNNLSEFEWVVRNKVYPVFWGRNINGENCLTKEEIDFLHRYACRISPISADSELKLTEEQGAEAATAAVEIVHKLRIPRRTAIFLLIPDDEEITRDYLKGYAERVMELGFTPGFKANTDAKYIFDREFSRGMQTDRETFKRCLVWALAPTLEEYDNITTTHLIQPDNWIPYAPSGITRKDIAVWQYGKDCHPIFDDKGEKTKFNINLVRNMAVIRERMF